MPTKGRSDNTSGAASSELIVILEISILFNRIKRLGQSRFLRNVVIVVTGTAGAQAVAMAFAPIISRLYGPEAFGVLGTFLAIISTLMPLAALTYPIAIVLAKTDSDAKGIAKLSGVVAGFLALITGLALVVAGEWITDVLSLQAVAGLLWLIPLAMLFSAWQQIFLQWLLRKKQFRTTARVAVIQALISNFSKFGAGWFYPTGAALVIIAAITQAVHAALLGLAIRNGVRAQPLHETTAATITELAKRHRDFPLYRAPQAALNAFTQGLPVLLLAGFFGPAIAGLFALTRSVLAAPAALIGHSVGSVFYPKAVELNDKPSQLKDLLLKSTGSLAVFSCLTFLPVVIAGPWLFSVVFGAEWREAGQFARWVSIWMTFSLAARPAISSLAVLALQRTFLLYEVLFLPLKILSLYVGVLLSEPIVAVALYSLVSSVFYILLWLLVWKELAKLSRPSSRHAKTAW